MASRNGGWTELTLIIHSLIIHSTPDVLAPRSCNVDQEAGQQAAFHLHDSVTGACPAPFLLPQVNFTSNSALGGQAGAMYLATSSVTLSEVSMSAGG